MLDFYSESKQDLASLFAKNTIRRTQPQESTAAQSAIHLPGQTPANAAQPAGATKPRKDINLGLKNIYASQAISATERRDAQSLPPAEQDPQAHQLFEHNKIRPRTHADQARAILLPLATWQTQRESLKAPVEKRAQPPLSPSDAPQASVPGDLSFNDLYYKYRKLQLHYSVSQILLKTSLPLEARLQEITALLLERFNLWQCHLFLRSAHTEQLHCIASTGTQSLPFLAKHPQYQVPLGDEKLLTQVLSERRDLLTGQPRYNRYLLPVSHQQRVTGILDLYHAPTHLLTVEEQSTLKTLAAQISNYLETESDQPPQQDPDQYDTLTGLASHASFQEQLETALLQAEKKRSWVSVILADLDFFKQINDVHGHRQGNRVLQQIATRLKAKKRSQDVIARYGGEEFALLLPDTSLENAEKIAHDLCRAIEAEAIDGNFESSLKITLSFGVAGLCAPRTNQRQQLITAAEKMLLLAKEKGRNQVCVDQALRHTPPSPGETPGRWSLLLKGQEEQIQATWLMLTRNYGVPEVTHAVLNLKGALPLLLKQLTACLEGRVSPAALQAHEWLPTALITQIQSGQAEFSLITFEMAVILLQETLRQFLEQKHLSGGNTEQVIKACDQFIERLNTLLKNLFEHHPVNG
jgi:diguanylate cyclase (GGDEF)-like protein